MGVKRRGHHSYVYQTIREGDRTKSVYVGPMSAEVPALVARMQVLQRESRATGAAIRAEERSRLAEAEADVRGVVAEIRELAGLAMAAAGFHQHARGPWRLRRMPKNIFAPGMFPPKGPEFDAYQERAFAGDEATRPGFRNFFERFPEQAADGGGDVVEKARDALIRQHAGKNVVMQEATRAMLIKVERDLAGDNPEPIERLLAERAALCWLACHVAEAKACADDRATSGMLERRLAGAHRRYLSALRMLATVRALAVPRLRVTVDARSVHLDGPPQGQIDAPG